MATTNPIVTGLTAYVEEHTLPLISKSVLGAKSAKMFTLQSGCKGDTALNLLDTEVVFGDGSACGWNETGSTEYSQRVIEAKPLKVNMAFCDKKMLKTWAQYEVRVAAGQKNLPFEEEWTNDIVEGVNEQIEKMIYQGDGDETNQFNGLINILDADCDNTVTKASGTSAYVAIKEVYEAIPARALKSDTVILVSDGMFRSYIQDLVSANLYHFNPSDAEGEYKLPGTSVRVIAVNGLNDTEDYEYIIAGRLSNLFYGTDLEGDAEKFELWYSQDNREFRLAIEFVGGVQVARPDEAVFGKVAK